METIRVNAYSVKNNSFFPALLRKMEAGYSLQKSDTPFETDLYITPGWIDLHAHVYCDPAGDTIGIDCDSMTGLERGVHTVIDPGTSGAYTVDDFMQREMKKQKTTIKAFLHINGKGITNSNRSEGADIDSQDIDAAVEAARRYPDTIIGIKVRIAKNIVLDKGIECLRRARTAADRLGLPVMVHIGPIPPETDEVLRLLQKGDILSHSFHGLPGSPWKEDGLPSDELQKAIDRGVIMDLAHGFSAFSFDVFKKAIAHPLPPFTISSDLHSRSWEFVGSLAKTMSKTLACGLSLPDVIRGVTVNPARVLGEAEPYSGWETVTDDSTLFRLVKNTDQTMLVDSLGVKILPEQLILPYATIRHGEYRVLENQSLEAKAGFIPSY